MIGSVRIRGFRCLLDVKIGFGPLTALVGPNGSGKSAVVDALTPVTFPARDHWRHQDKPIDILIEHDGGAQSHRVGNSLPKENRVEVQKLQLHLAALRAENEVVETPALKPDGTNLTSAFDTLSRPAQQELVAQFTRIVPLYQDVDAKPSAIAGRKRLVFQDRWQAGLWYEPYEVSDGSLFTLALLLLQFQSVPLDLIAIEEPERGLHPYLVGELVRMLRALSRAELGPRAIQVVLATHSADLLNCLEPSEVRFLTRSEEDGSTQVEVAPTGSPDWTRAYKEYDRSMGRIWLSGGMGGVPGG